MRPGPRPDFRINEDRPEIRPLWVTNTGTTIALRPVITTDLCIVGGADGVIRALSLSDGRQRWSFRTGGPVFSSPDTGRGLVVCGSADGGVYALEAATGEERWRTLTPSAIVGAPAIDGGAVYIGGSDGHLRSLGLDDGRVLWISDSIGGFIEARPAVAESLVIVGAWDGTLYAFGRGDGHIRWSWRGERPGALYAPAACTPVVTQGLVYIVAPDRAMTCLALGTGREVWRSRRHQVRESIGSSPDRTTIFVHTMQDSVVAFDAGSRTPRERWWSRVGFGYDLNPAPPLVVGGELVYGTMKGLVFALDASSGTVRWEHRAGVSLVNPIVSAGTGRFVIADMDGMVQLLTEGK
jgi:outer membrane protein assembly factor BamB